MKELQPGLKKGERFLDGERVFIIEEVLPNGQYISHLVQNAEKPEENQQGEKPAEEKAETKAEDDSNVLDKADYEKLSKAELLQLAKNLDPGISEKMKKDELISFLEAKIK